jgi:DNA polymerase-3 subunit alpha
LEKVEYVHADLKEALSDTYGVIVFQEQFIEVIHRLGGISLVDSDTIRSALGKKDKGKLEKFKSRFISGASRKIGMSRSEEVWNQIEKAAGYTFNRSHSAAYSCLAFISQYLKVYHPAHFWAAQIDWDTRKNKQDEMLRHKKIAHEMGVDFQMPDINESRENCYVAANGQPRWSFIGIKGIGLKTALEITKHQPYKNFEDFYKRVNKSKVRFNNMVNMVYAGVFDSFGDRKQHLNWIYNKKDKKKPHLTAEKLMKEYLEVMGFFEQKLKKIMTGFSSHCTTESNLKKMLSGEMATVGGMVLNVRSIRTKKGSEMAFGNLVDKDELIQLTFFPTVWLKYKSEIKNSKILEVDGFKSNYQNKENLIEVKSIREI